MTTRTESKTRPSVSIDDVVTGAITGAAAGAMIGSAILPVTGGFVGAGLGMILNVRLRQLVNRRESTQESHS